jgi:hypothetical protein
VAPGVYFRMHLVGFFDGIESERMERPCAPCARLGGARRTRLRGQANGEKRDPLQTAEATLALVLRPLFGVGNPRGWAERAQATFLALSASVRAQLHCWHAVIRSRIGFSRAVDLFHAPEPQILLRWLSLDPPISQGLPPDHAQTGALQAGRAGGCVFAQDSALVPGVRLRVRSHHARASCTLGFVAALDAGRHHPAIRGGTPKSRREKPPAFV